MGRQGRVLRKRTLNFILKKEEKVPNAGPILSKSFWLQIPENEMAIFFMKREGSDLPV